MDTQPWKLFRAERDALYRLTIPAFYLDADRTVAEDWNGQITNLHARDGLSVALDRLAKLDEAEAERQCSFAAVALGHQRPARTRPPAQAAADDFVLELVEHLRERAIFEAGSAAWLGLEYTDHRLMSQVVPIGYDLYNGALGVAVFLSAAARVRGYAGAFDLAKQALAPINGGLQSRNKHRLARSIGIGGFLGLGSLAYGLTVCAQLLEDDECLAGAHMAASLIDANAIGADNRYDLIGGSAGAILGIMKLHEATQSPELLRQAVSIADVLLSRPRNKGEPWASKLFDLQALTGVSHGASGFALAFARLHKGTGDQRYAAVVDDCLAFERAAFDATAGNWRDTRPSAMRGASSSPNQWCYGAAGIGYARLGLRALKNTAEDSTAKSLDAAIASVLALRTPSSDTLCCGAAGHADFLTAAATALDRPDLLAASQAIIADMSQRWRQTGDARWDLGGKDFNLGLMRGVAGLGYAALRSESPKLPQILILQ
jgi:type 2 lantibiotic biosynthesis protein LanM